MMVKKAQTLTKIDMKTLSKPVLLDFLVIFQHILFFFFLYITCLQMGKSIPNWQFQAIDQDSKRSEKLREDLRKLSKEI